MVSVIVILPRVKVPTSHLIAVYTVEVNISNKRAPVIFCQECAIWLSPCLVLDVGGNGVLRQRRKHIVFGVCTTSGERLVVQTPKRAELSQNGQSAIDEVLISSSKVIIDDPMEVSFLGREAYVDEVGA